jgi:hypothetical protein
MLDIRQQQEYVDIPGSCARVRVGCLMSANTKQQMQIEQVPWA